MTRAVSRGASSYRAKLRSFSAPALKGAPPAPPLARANDKPWAKETWKRPIADAVAAVKLPVGTAAYTLRHSTITDLVDTRLSIGVQKGPPIGVQKGPPSSSSVTGMTGALFVLVAA